MDHSVSAAEANRSFSRLLRQVQAGRSIVVTAHGRPVARLVPCDDIGPARAAARETLLARLSAQPARALGRWRRDELYDR